MPLTTITAWETMFEEVALIEPSTGDLLELGAGAWSNGPARPT
jgi:hypothetical protein